MERAAFMPNEIPQLSRDNFTPHTLELMDHLAMLVFLRNKLTGQSKFFRNVGDAKAATKASQLGDEIAAAGRFLSEGMFFLSPSGDITKNGMHMACTRALIHLRRAVPLANSLAASERKANLELGATSETEAHVMAYIAPRLERLTEALEQAKGARPVSLPLTPSARRRRALALRKAPVVSR
jgi:hypothetical protein